MKRFFQPIALSAFPSFTLLLLRLMVGAAFVLHGWGKIQTPFAWLPAQAPVAIPGILQCLAAISEFGGGMALILGLLTRLGAFGLACTMGVAVYFHAVVNKDPFVNHTGGMSYEPALVYLGIALVFLALGPGKFSLDSKIFSERA